ncbi:MAG: hypothetical protein GF334_07055 [Candidatus Altiarchaeales archaeon]|nr:hypothetical protein [Candidatus Altiarchaeales archaeon]
MAQVYVCMIRTDIPDSVLQVLDLKPNESQRSFPYDPPGQTKYLRRADNDTVSTQTAGGVITTVAAYDGVAAYLIDNVEKGGLAAGTGALTASDANTIAAAILAAMDTPSALDLASVNALIAATAANSELTNAGGSASTGSLAALLQILAGGVYTVPAGATLESAGVMTAAATGSMNANKYRPTYDTGALQLSLNLPEGDLYQLSQANFTYASTAGAAVQVFSATGTLL